MIRSALAIALVLSSAAWAETPVTGPEVPDGGVVDTSTLPATPTPFDALNERLLGAASRAVRFDWRSKTVGVGATLSSILELNNFASAKIGAFAKFPMGDFLVELAFSRTIVWGSESTGMLAQTPYRQAGRPNRFELDINVEYVLAEGVVTPRPTFIPPAQLVFSATAGARYFLYTEIFKGLDGGEVALAIINPSMSQKEIDNLEVSRLPGMAIDRARITLLLGVNLDIYFRPGLFVSPRVMISPVFVGNPGSVASWWELNVRVGWML